jgi:glycosyl transferase family 25
MDKSRDRWQRISSELDDLHMNYERFPAIEGKKLDQEEINEKTTFMVRNFLCSYSVVGCALSHLAVWEKIASGTDKFVCIAEDDATFLDSFPKFLEDIEDIYDNTEFDVINLYGDFIPIGKTIYKNKDYSLVNPIFCLSLCCYVVTREGARKMVEQVNGKISFQADSYVAFLNLNGKIKQLVLTGLEVVKPSLEESTINQLNSGGVLNKIMGSSSIKNI